MMATWIAEQRQRSPIQLLEPSVGRGALLDALVAVRAIQRQDRVVAVDVDPAMVALTKARRLVAGVTVDPVAGDYLLLDRAPRFDAAVMNPPYVRQEWIVKKAKYSAVFAERFDVAVPATSNLFVYFVVKALHELRDGAPWACVIYDAWQSTKYGRWLAEYLSDRCRLINVEHVRQRPFPGRLIDATVLLGIKGGKLRTKLASAGHTANGPLATIAGFEQLGAVAHSRRGLRLKQASFFLVRRPGKVAGATRFLKKLKTPRFSITATEADHALLIAPGETLPDVRRELQKRLREARLDPRQNATILNWRTHRERSWFYHRPPPTAHVLLNYFLRSRPRHVWAPTIPYSDNFYGLTFHDDRALAWFAILNSTAACLQLLANARNQGVGLLKLQLFEYRRSIVPSLRQMETTDIGTFSRLGAILRDAHDEADVVISKIDRHLRDVFDSPALEPNELRDMLRGTLSHK